MGAAPGAALAAGRRRRPRQRAGALGAADAALLALVALALAAWVVLGHGRVWGSAGTESGGDENENGDGRGGRRRLRTAPQFPLDPATGGRAEAPEAAGARKKRAAGAGSGSGAAGAGPPPGARRRFTVPVRSRSFVLFIFSGVAAGTDSEGPPPR